jgi:hypothetical protein
VCYFNYNYKLENYTLKSYVKKCGTLFQTENGTIAFTEFSAFVYQTVVGLQDGIPILTDLAGFSILFNSGQGFLYF